MFGKTATAIAYYDGKNFTEDGSDSNSFGLFLVQNIDKIATEGYIGGRYHRYDEDDRDFRDIFAMHFGARIKF